MRTFVGNVGTKVIDVNGGASAFDVIQAINAQQGETGGYAAAQTRVILVHRWLRSGKERYGNI